MFFFFTIIFHLFFWIFYDKKAIPEEYRNNSRILELAIIPEINKISKKCFFENYFRTNFNDFDENFPLKIDDIHENFRSNK